MKRPLIAVMLSCACVLCSPGCRKSHIEVDATKPLQQSFHTASPEVRQSIEAVNSGLRSGDYNAATLSLAPVVQNQPLSEAQKQAVAAALQQINQAVAANPQLDSAEMYKKRKQMFEQVYGGSRF